MPHKEKHPKVNAAGEITHVFGHRFVLKTGSKSVLADLTPRGLEVVGLRIGDRVALESEQNPSEIKVSKLERNGETFAIGRGPHDTCEDEADPAIAIKLPRTPDIKLLEDRAANQSILRCWEKRAPNLRSFTSSSTEMFGRLSQCPRTITNGNPNWSSKAHLMNAETDRRA
jgi:hypothetical protein